MFNSGSHCHEEAQMSRVTAICWAQAFSPCLDSGASCKNRPAVESLLMGRLDGSLCWLQVTMQDMDLCVKSAELAHCNLKEGEENKCANYVCNTKCHCIQCWRFCNIYMLQVLSFVLHSLKHAHMWIACQFAQKLICDVSQLHSVLHGRVRTSLLLLVTPVERSFWQQLRHMRMSNPLLYHSSRFVCNLE